MSPIVIREGCRDDWHWLSSRFAIEYHSAAPARGVPVRVLISKLEALLEAPDWRLIVCVPADEPTEILGALLYRPPTDPDWMQRAAWMQVKPEWRRRGVATALLKDAKMRPGQVHCAFLPPEVGKAADPKGWRLRFRPYLPDIAVWERLKVEAKRAA